MKTLFVIAVAIAVANARILRAPGIATIQELAEQNENKIINGQPATLGQFPHQASVRIDGSSFCGGSLIHARWVLTAAHCAFQRTSFQIGLGTLSSSVSQHTTTTKVVHAGYSQTTLNNDVAVLNLPTAASGANIGTIALGTANIGGAHAVRVSGWGRTSQGGGVSPTLMWTNLETITNQACADVYGSIIVASTICTSVSSGSSTCNGDSGGPLIDPATSQQVGVVSFGSSAGCNSAPNGFARVSSFRQWIIDNTDL